MFNISLCLARFTSLFCKNIIPYKVVKCCYYKNKPIFYSNEYFFLVSLPNRGIASKIKDATEETQLTGEETQLTGENVHLEVLMTSIRQKCRNKFRAGTVDKFIKLLIIYEDKYPFNRQIVATQFEISENAASRLLKKAIDCGIVRKEKRGVYYFRVL